MDVRRKYPFMGKARIHAMLARKERHLSVSTVGRILAASAIRPASFCEGRVKHGDGGSPVTRCQRTRCLSG